MALGSTESHAVWLKLMIPHLGLTQAMDLKVIRNDMVWETLIIPVLKNQGEFSSKMNTTEAPIGTSESTIIRAIVNSDVKLAL